MNPGIYDMPAAEYHLDPTPEPSLSSSIAHILCTSSPVHARAAHPRLNPAAESKEASALDIGTAAHAVLLEGVAAVEIIDAENWRTKAAQQARDEARLVGKTPLLVGVWAEVQAMVAAAREQLAQHEIGGLGVGKPERVLVWQEDEAWCRSRVDWLTDDHRTILDFKTTSATANPEAVSRTVFANAWDLKSAFYLRGLQVLTGVRAEFRFIVQETFFPYALSVVAMDPAVETIGEKKRVFALEAWQECLRRDVWPGYPRQTAYVSLPTWEESKWLARERPTGEW